MFKSSQSVFFLIAGKPRYDLCSNEEVEYFSRGKFSCIIAMLVTHVQAVVNVAMILQVQCNVRNFLTILVSIIFSGRTVVHFVGDL